MPNVFENNDQSIDNCPRCDEPVYCVVKQVDKPTKYFHARNNQADLIHEDLSTEMPAKTIHSAHSVDGFPLCMPMEYWERNKGRFTATNDDNEVTCRKCKDILTQMYKEIGKHNG